MASQPEITCRLRFRHYDIPPDERPELIHFAHNFVDWDEGTCREVRVESCGVLPVAFRAYLYRGPGHPIAHAAAVAFMYGKRRGHTLILRFKDRNGRAVNVPIAIDERTVGDAPP